MQHCQSLKDWQCCPLTVVFKRMLGISPDYVATGKFDNFRKVVKFRNSPLAVVFKRISGIFQITSRQRPLTAPAQQPEPQIKHP